MILDSIKLENFGAYGGINEAELTPADQQPVVLFGGMNGGGKTTLLDALLLVLYGPKAKVSNRTGRMAYDNYLRECIHRGGDPGEGASITLRFRRMMEGQTHYFELQRSWLEALKGIEETVYVLRDGEPDPILTEHWDEVVEAYLPVSISNLFFFDGEQIKELAEGSNAAHILGTAIRSLLGLDLVDRLEGDLKTFERRKKADALDPEAAKKLKQAEHELQEFDGQLEKVALERGRLTNEAGRLACDAKIKEDRFKAEGGDLFVQRKELERELQELENAKAEAEADLREIASGPLPLRLVENLLGQVESQVRVDSEIRQNRVLVDVLIERDEKLLQQLKSTKLDDNALKKVCLALDDDRNTRQQNANQEPVFDTYPHLAPHIAHLLGRVLPKAQEASQSCIEKIRQLEEKIARVHSELGRVPEADAIAKFQNEMESSRKTHATKMAEIDGLDIRIEVLKRRREEATRQLERFGEQDHAVRIAEDDRQRMLKHSKRVRDTLDTFRTKVIARHVANMEALMLESFQKLLRKTDLVHGLKIDPETFEVTLRDRRGEVLPFDRLSAGERQLLATAMLWGLARASGRPIPTVIDTPLGRLDSTHRAHLVERYFPQASHQVLLLSTDEEIVNGYHTKLKPAVARHYLLDHDEKAGRTAVKPGYFEKS
jgi:DNA sulfur modification protein DndD